jgi:hypothetical protein
MIREHRERVDRAARIGDRLLELCGHRFHYGIWRRRKVTMHGLKFGEIGAALDRERLRRAVEGIDDHGEEVDRLGEGLERDCLLSFALSAYPGNVDRQARLFEQVGALAEALAGPSPSPALRLLARSVALLQHEAWFIADRCHRVTAVEGGLFTKALRDLDGLRTTAERRLNANVKALSYVCNIESDHVRAITDRYRLVG